MAIRFLKEVFIDGTLQLTVNADDATYTGLVTVDGGVLKYRTKILANFRNESIIFTNLG